MGWMLFLTSRLRRGRGHRIGPRLLRAAARAARAYASLSWSAQALGAPFVIFGATWALSRLGFAASSSVTREATTLLGFALFLSLTRALLTRSGTGRTERRR